MRSLAVPQNSIKASENGPFRSLRQESRSPASCDFKRASVRGDFFGGGFIATGTWSPRLSGYIPKRQPFPFLHLWKQVSGKRVVSSSGMSRHCLLFTQGASEPACVSGLSRGIRETCFVCWQVCLSMSCELSLRLWLLNILRRDAANKSQAEMCQLFFHW